MSKKLIVLFPGINYGVDCPLLYYAGFQYELAGYEKIKISSYGVKRREGMTLGDYADRALAQVKKQLKGISFRDYGEIVFASKSIGTVIAMRVEDEMEIAHVSHILLTPIDITLPYMEKDRDYRYLVTGTSDRKINLEHLREICRRKDLPLTEVEGVGHRLETKADMAVNLDIMKKVVLQMAPPGNIS